MKLLQCLMFLQFFLINELYARKYHVKTNRITKDYVNQVSWLKVVPLKNLLIQNPSILYLSVFDPLDFEYPEFSIAPHFANKGYFDELFVLSIPNGKVQGEQGHVFIENKMAQELVWSQRYHFVHKIPKVSESNIIKIKGKVAVIAQFGSNNYFHFTNEILGRLAILEMAGIEYDWLYVPHQMKYAKELLQLWGIDDSKIISPDNDNFCIQADELIVPSLVSNTSVGHNHAGSFIHPITMSYVKEKLLKAVISQDNSTISALPKKIFISRKDSYAARKILNEDEIFKLFEQKGFKRFELSKLSVIDQILLFMNADIVVSEQGSGLANILFCKPETKVIEIFQALMDNCFWWQSNVGGLKYVPYMTISVNSDDFVYCDFGLTYNQAWTSKINVSLDPIKVIIQSMKDDV